MNANRIELTFLDEEKEARVTMFLRNREVKSTAVCIEDDLCQPYIYVITYSEDEAEKDMEFTSIEDANKEMQKRTAKVLCDYSRELKEVMKAIKQNRKTTHP